MFRSVDDCYLITLKWLNGHAWMKFIMKEASISIPVLLRTLKQQEETSAVIIKNTNKALLHPNLDEPNIVSWSNPFQSVVDCAERLSVGPNLIHYAPCPIPALLDPCGSRNVHMQNSLTGFNNAIHFGLLIRARPPLN